MASPSRRLCSGALVLGALLLALLPPAAAQEPAIATGRGTVLELTVPAPSLAGNLLGDPAEQPAWVYLPPGYDRSPDRRFPVLYLLHGFGDSPRVWTEAWDLPGILDQLIAAAAVPELIAVMPSGRNAYLGSFYLDSPVTGSWGQYIALDLVGFIDQRFRTLPEAASRGLAGHSMGGFGALHLAMAHPGVFAAVYAMSPCCLDLAEDLGHGNQAWRRALALATREDLTRAMEARDFYALAYAALTAALSPAPDRPPLYLDFPVRQDPRRGELFPAEPAHSRWRARLPAQRVAAARAELLALRALALDYGVDEQFAHIPAATLAFARSLAEHRIPHRLEVYDGDHRDRYPERLRTRVLPFFGQALATEVR